MDRDCYKEASKILDSGKFIVYSEINRNNYKRLEKFRDIIQDIGGTILLETGD